MHSIFRRASRFLLGAFAAALFVATASGQASKPVLGPPNESNHFIETPKGWVHPKTAWGDPDLTGVWPISFVGTVPMERCAGGGGGRGGRGTPCDPNKAWKTEAAYKAEIEAALGRGDAGRQLIEQGNFGAALLRGVTDPTMPQRQTSLIVDPPNGRLPEMTAEGKRLSAMMKSSWALPGETLTWDAPEDFDSWDRCITRGLPSSMLPYRYNNGINIFQAPGYVVLSLEMIHEDRIIPVNGKPPLSAAHKHYMGEPRGHWEGNTLVVETTNFKPGASATNIGVMGAPAGNRFPISEKMKITERFTRLNDEMMLYEQVVDDPVIMTRPYTVRFPLRNDPTYEWWEYACHEGNRTIRDYINSSRAERASPGAGSGQPR